MLCGVKWGVGGGVYLYLGGGTESVERRDSSAAGVVLLVVLENVCAALILN